MREKGFANAFFFLAINQSINYITKQQFNHFSIGLSEYSKKKMAENETLNTVLSYIVDVFLILSIVGSGLTVITFMLFPKLRTYPIRLILYLCMAIFFAQTFFYVAFEAYDGIMCLPSAIILHYFFLADFIWTFCVAFNFYQMIVKRNRDAESFEKYYHLASWGLPFIFVIAIAATKNYVRRDAFCYMNAQLPVFLGFFVPGLLVVCANAVIFFFIAREIHDTLKNAPRSDKKEKSKEFRVYFSIFVSIGLSWIFGFIMTFFNDGVTDLIFLVLFSITTPLQGFLIFLSYCINDKVISNYARIFSKCFPFCRRWENLANTTAQPSSTTGSNSSTSTHSSRSENLSSSTNSVSMTPIK
ncbi:G-protein-coupled receptor family protein [Heterostelium album PN500]|uniref:G-protein-coupled receptor family protein n=1 Tax=Heterostelium pallidum (strain ATCC 26659 / Pp 5 / PN500) TaxID=670386 RepID=D3B489_HETP5|nr:G-protein-coupled receptor family protein [Heterostelium album PN500]EFA84137.1 G-protein-coupled receptor family protein [Heterostelium album PN500]|eukprot:XP_020436254.1 G-protein-coupled receptor family protein [Heterostelium album PN500]